MNSQAAKRTREALPRIAQEKAAAGANMFMGKPDSWYADTHWRCSNDHVSVMYLKSEQFGRALCLLCGEPVYLTFPEDVEGPLHGV